MKMGLILLITLISTISIITFWGNSLNKDNKVEMECKEYKREYIYLCGMGNSSYKCL